MKFNLGFRVSLSHKHFYKGCELWLSRINKSQSWEVMVLFACLTTNTKWVITCKIKFYYSNLWLHGHCCSAFTPNIVITSHHLPFEYMKVWDHSIFCIQAQQDKYMFLFIKHDHVYKFGAFACKYYSFPIPFNLGSWFIVVSYLIWQVIVPIIYFIKGCYVDWVETFCTTNLIKTLWMLQW